MKYFFHTAALVGLLAGSVAAQNESAGAAGMAGGPGTPAGAPAEAAVDNTILSLSDVTTAITNAVTSVNVPLVVAVTDRQGNILALYRKKGAPVTAIANYGLPADANEVAVALARTASFFSNNQAPLSSRTVRFISGVHFPPGIKFTSNADLYGIENTNRGCGFNTTFLPGVNLPAAKSVDNRRPGLGILTGKADLFDSDPNAVNPGGVPLFKNGIIVGGVGVVGPTYPIAEYAAAVPAISPPFAVAPSPPGVVIIGGIALPFVFQTTAPAGTTPGTMDGDYVPIPYALNPASGIMVQAPQPSPAAAPEGDLIQVKAGKLLSAADVRLLINNSIATANSIRGVIRLPLGARARMAIAIADLDGTLLGLYRMVDSTIFSIDVAVAKSRNVIYFTQHPGNDLPGIKTDTAVTNRTISFGAQPFFPPGIDYAQPGPFFNLFKFDTANPCTQGADPSTNGNKNGIVFFPGALPLYKNGVLVGGLGISGDGVDQDDFVTAGGAAGFEAPPEIRADRIFIDGVRMPYLKFPRNPTD